MPRSIEKRELGFKKETEEETGESLQQELDDCKIVGCFSGAMERAKKLNKEDDIKKYFRKFWEDRIKKVKQGKSIMEEGGKVTSYDLALAAEYADNLDEYASELGLNEEEQEKYYDIGYEFHRSAYYTEEEEKEEEGQANL